MISMTNFEYMVRLKGTQEREGKKPMWVYWRFIQEHPEDIYPEDFIKLANILGYKKSWAEIKQREWIKDKKLAKESIKEFREIKAKDRRYSKGSDFRPNKKF